MNEDVKILYFSLRVYGIDNTRIVSVCPLGLQILEKCKNIHTAEAKCLDYFPHSVQQYERTSFVEML